MTYTCKQGVVIIFPFRLRSQEALQSKSLFHFIFFSSLRFDVIFVTLAAEVIRPCQSALKQGGKLVTIVVPFIANFNKYGMMLGMVVNAALKLRWMVEASVMLPLLLTMRHLNCVIIRTKRP